MDISLKEEQATLDLLTTIEAATREMIPLYGTYDQAWKRWHEWALDLIYDKLSGMHSKEEAIFILAERVPDGGNWIETLEAMFR